MFRAKMAKFCTRSNGQSQTMICLLVDSKNRIPYRTPPSPLLLIYSSIYLSFMNQKQRFEKCVMCDLVKHISDLDFWEDGHYYTCKYSAASGLKSCTELQESYLDMENRQERPQ